ncbi:MAG: accessory gene regulator B family protein [Bacillota bacterium]
MSFSEKVAAYLIKNKEIKNDDQQEILVFGAQVFFGLLSGIVITLLVGYLIKVHVQVFYMLLVSIFIRKTAGGAHSEDPFHCLLITC